MIKIRKLELEDSDLIYQWRNDDLIVSLSSLQKKVSIKEHEAWIKSSLENLNRVIYIVERDKIPIGQIRFDKDIGAEQLCYISIYLISGFKSKGYGKQALQLAFYEIFNVWHDITIQAKVRQDNKASIHFFLNVGFQKVNEDDVFSTFNFGKLKYDHFKNKKLYNNLVDKYGIDHRTLNWGSYKSQIARLKIFTEIGDLENKSILDVGCGISDLYDLLKKQQRNFEYKGIDLTENMIVKSEERFPGIDVEVADILEYDNKKKYDYVFASGILTYQSDYFLKLFVQKAFSLCNIGIAFNALNANSKNQDKNEFYVCPISVMEFCKTLTPYITIRLDYHLNDFTIYMFKENAYIN